MREVSTVLGLGSVKEDREAILKGITSEVVPRIVDEIRAANAHAVSEDALQAVLSVTAALGSAIGQACSRGRSKSCNSRK